MAIKFKEQLEKKKKEDIAPLTDEELGYITEVEEYIDKEIEKKINSDNNSVMIFLYYATFITRISDSTPREIYPPMTSARRKLLQDTLLDRYKKAGWTHKVEIDDGLDGNMSGADYLILSGKK